MTLIELPKVTRTEAFEMIREAVKRNLEGMPQLPCRVDEMTDREHEIFRVGAFACGALSFVQEVIDTAVIEETDSQEAVAAEREACARIAEAPIEGPPHTEYSKGKIDAANIIARNIRARGPVIARKRRLT